MPVPATTGQLKSKISDMQIGDYVKCWYSFHKTSGSLSDSPAGILVGLGTDTFSTAGEKPVTGESTTNSSTFFYFVKVAKGLLIADRVCQHSISWDVLNAGKVIQGKPYSFSTSSNISQGCASSENISGTLRSLTGGVAYADDSGSMSTTDKEIGAWPVNNEWDKYIVNFPIDKIQTGKTIDDVFRFLSTSTWCQDTPSLSMPSAPNTARVGRGHLKAKEFGYIPSTIVTANLACFRPVFEYKEV